MNENIIDYGNWTVPSGWNELTLKQFQDIEQYYSDKEKKVDVREVLHLLTDHSIDEIGQLPIEFVNKLLERLIWLQEAPKWDDPTNKVEIDGEQYIVNTKEKLKTGEYIAVDTVLKSDKNNYAAILAILCRKEGEIFDSKFENEILQSRIELWEKQPITKKFENEILQSRIELWEKQPITKIMPIMNFFLQCFLILRAPSQMSMEIQEAINLIRKDIETSVKNGEHSKHFMKSVMKKLKKLEKCTKSI